jgi:hypothetical protein
MLSMSASNENSFYPAEMLPLTDRVQISSFVINERLLGSAVISDGVITMDSWSLADGSSN